MYHYLISIYLIMFIGFSKVAAQLLPIQYKSEEKSVDLTFQPIVTSKSSPLQLRFGLNLKSKDRTSSHLFGLHTIEQSRLTGISYYSKSNHIYFHQRYDREFLLTDQKNFRSINLTLKNELFFHKSLSKVDLTIHSIELILSRAKTHFGFKWEIQSEKMLSFLESDRPVLFNNYCAEIFFGRIISNRFSLQNRLLIGEAYNNRRITNRLTNKIMLTSRTNLNLQVEYNMVNGITPLTGFFFITSLETHCGKELGFHWTTVHFGTDLITATIGGLELRKAKYLCKLEYHEILDDHMHRIVTDRPAFASKFLLQLTFLL